MEIILVYALVPLFFLLAGLFVVLFLSRLAPTSEAQGTTPTSSTVSGTNVRSDQKLAYIFLGLLLMVLCVLALLNKRGQPGTSLS